MVPRGWLLVCAFLCLASVAFAQDRPIVAVFDIEVKGAKLDKGTVDRLTDYLGSLLASKGYQVVPRSELKERLVAEKKGSYKPCYDQVCQIEIGKELAAQKSLASQVLKIGSQCKVTVNLYDLKKSASEGAGTGSAKCGEDEVVESLEKAVNELFARELEAIKQAEEKERKETEDLKTQREAQEAADKLKKTEAVVHALAEQEVKQPGTNLYWLRCPVGRKWIGSSCSGTPSNLDWKEAIEGCPAGYRLPTRLEFLGLLGGCDAKASAGRRGQCSTCKKSATCSSLFGADEGTYWSSSPYSEDSKRAWYVLFRNGLVGDIAKGLPSRLRCIRSGS